VKDYISRLDTRRFGFNIARIDDPRILLDPALDEGLKTQNIALVITRIDSRESQTLDSLHAAGFTIEDTQFTYRFPYHGPILRQPADPHITIRDATADDIPGFREIASQAFENYGHYFADQRLDRARCREIYPDWAERTLTDPSAATRVFVAEYDRRLAGFLSFILEEKAGERYAYGIMGAVSPGLRGKNIFTHLAVEGLLWGQQENLNWQEHNVLTFNQPVNRVFTKLGFQQVSSFTTLHYWPEA
jgi:hypothetical protein